MIGAICGDIIGSPYEGTVCPDPQNAPLFTGRSCFTDDSVLTVATANAILNHTTYKESYISFGRAYPKAGYGRSFKNWLESDVHLPYFSYGNGSAMRTSPIGYAFNTEENVLNEALKQASCTHNHEEGIKGAQAVSLAIFLARNGNSRDEIIEKCSKMFNYDLTTPYPILATKHGFDISCQGTVPVALIAFHASDSFEDTIRKILAIGGDTDTLAAISGSIAEAYYKEIPHHIIKETFKRLPGKFIPVIKNFYKKYIPFARYI